MIIKSSTHTEDKLFSALYYNTVANLVTHLTGGILNYSVFLFNIKDMTKDQI